MVEKDGQEKDGEIIKVRYKTTGEVTYSSQFNVMALSEVLTCDDSPFISELDMRIEAKQE